MLNLMRDFSWSSSVLFIIGTTLLLSFFLTFLFKRFFKVNVENQDIVIKTVDFVGLVLVFLVGFSILLSQTWYREAQDAIDNESNSLTTLIRFSQEFDKDEEEGVKKAILAYVNYVAFEEWPLLMAGKNVDKTAEAYLQALFKAFEKVSISSQKEEIFYSQAITIVDRFLKERSKRIEFGDASLHPMLWLLLLISGGILIFLVMFFRISDFKYKFFVNYIFILLVALLLFFVFLLDYPFRGEIHLRSNNFQKILKQHSVVAMNNYS